MDHALFSDGTMESSKGVSVSISLKRTLIKFNVDRRQAVGVLPDCFLRIAVSASASPLFSLPRPTVLVPAVHRARLPVLQSPPRSGEMEGREKAKKRRHDIIPATPPPAASNSPTTNLFRRHWASFDSLDVLFKPAPATTAVNKFELTIHCNAKDWTKASASRIHECRSLHTVCFLDVIRLNELIRERQDRDITFRPTSHYAAMYPLAPSLPTSSCVLFSLSHA